MPRSSFSVLLFCLVWQVCGHAFAAVPLSPLSEYVVETWETDRGLPHNSTSGAIQQEDGFVWVATQGGLVRFDGFEFKQIRSPLIAGPRSSSVTGIIKENSDTLLIITLQSGLLRVRGGEVTPHPLNETLDPDNKIQVLFREGENVFWLFFRDRQVWRWNRGEVEKFPAPDGSHKARVITFAKDRDGTIFIARSAVTGMEQYKNGRLQSVYNPGWPIILGSSASGGPWVAFRGDLSRWENNKPVSTAPGPWDGGPVPQIIHEDRSGALWIAASEQRLLRWKDGVKTLFETSHVRVNQIDEDDLGNVWISTNGGGLSYVQRTKLALIEGTASWTDSASASACEDLDGNIWFANWKSVQRIGDGQIEVLSSKPGWPGRAIPIASDHAGNVWMATADQLYRAAPRSVSPPETAYRTPGSIRVLFPAKDGSLWVAGSFSSLIRRAPNGTWTVYAAAQGFSGDEVRSIGEGPDGTLWAGTRDGRLFHFAGERFTEPHAGAFGGHEIRALHTDKEGCLWIGTAGAGLFVRRGERLVQIGGESGLSDDLISQILEDDFGWLWFGSRRGIFKVEKTDLLNRAFGNGETVTSVLFGRGDGLPGVSAVGSYQPTAVKTRSGRLWFVTRKGLVTTDPAQRDNDVSPPRVYLEQFLVDGRRVGTGSAAVYSSARRFEFRFTSPSFVSPERLRFRYRLDGFDSEWVEAGSQRFAAYPRLAPGKYVFTVSAQQDGRTWSPAGPSFAFVVRPMWWESPWVRACALLVGVTGLVLLVRYVSHRRLKARLARLEQERRVELERVRIARDLHDDLGSSLTYASMMAEELSDQWRNMPDPSARSAELASCVRTIVRDLDAVVWTVSPTHDTLAALSGYIRHFAVEYFKPTPIECRVQMGADIPPYPLSPDVRHHLFLVVKELFNNALKHSAARNVAVVIRVIDGLFELEVADDGRGFAVADIAASSRHGLKNLQARAQELGATLEVSSSSQGTRTILRFPLSQAGKNAASPPLVSASSS